MELLVAMTLGLLLIAGVGQIYLAAKHSYNVQTSMAHIQDVGRYVTEELTRDIRRAGYWGLMDMRSPGVKNASGNSYPTGLSSPLADTTCPTGNSDWGRTITQAIFGLDNLAQSATAYACLNNMNLDGRDVLVIRYADPGPVTSYTASSLYVRTAPYETSVVFGNPDNCPPGASGCTLYNYVTAFPNQGNYDYAVVAHAYYVANSSTATECGDPTKPPLPALMREELDSSGRPVAHELATGVEDLQFQYNEGSQYKNAANVANWQNVTAVRFWVLVRDACPDTTYNDRNAYYLDPNDPAFQPNDHYRRALYTSTVALRNTN